MASSAPVAVVTGVTGALGRATALELARRGATVVLVARDAARASAVLGEVQAVADGGHRLVLADLSDPAAAQAAGDEVRRRFREVQALVHTAAVYRRERHTTPAGHEVMFATNHLGPFVLTQALLPALEAGAPARVVTVTAPSTSTIDFDDLQGARRFKPLHAFGASKAANLLFAFALARRLEGTGVTSNAFHPGLMRSQLVREMPAPLRLFLGWVSRPPEGAAKDLAGVALGPAHEGVTGRFFVRDKPSKAPKGSEEDGAQRRLWDESERLAAAALADASGAAARGAVAGRPRIRS